MIGSPRGIDILPLPPHIRPSFSLFPSLVHLCTFYLRIRLTSLPVPSPRRGCRGCFQFLRDDLMEDFRVPSHRPPSHPTIQPSQVLSGSLHANTRSINLLVASDTTAVVLCLFPVCLLGRSYISESFSRKSITLDVDYIP